MRPRDAAALAALLASVAVGWFAYDVPGAVPAAAPVVVAELCDEAYGWVDASGASVDFSSERVVASNAAWRTCLTTPGVLSLRLRGSTVVGIGAQVVVALGHTNVWEGFVTDPIALEINVPHGGTVLLAFVNDRYEPPEDRNLWISDVAFTPR